MLLVAVSGEHSHELSTWFRERADQLVPEAHGRILEVTTRLAPIAPEDAEALAELRTPCAVGEGEDAGGQPGGVPRAGLAHGHGPVDRQS